MSYLIILCCVSRSAMRYGGQHSRKQVEERRELRRQDASVADTLRGGGRNLGHAVPTRTAAFRSPH